MMKLRIQSTTAALNPVRTTALVLLLASASSACNRAVIAQEPSSGPVAQPAGTEWVTMTPNTGRANSNAISTSAPRGGVEETRTFKFNSRKDSLEWVSARKFAMTPREEFRVIVSLQDRNLWVVDAMGDTLRKADVAVARDETFTFNGRSWTFRTPRGKRVVRLKQENPVWTPPDWHYAEVARDYSLKLKALPRRGSVKLKDGAVLSVRDSLVGITKPGKKWEALPVEYEVVFDSTLYIPPIGTKNRRIEGQLGKFKLDMGEGFMLHGTPYQHTVGGAVTHGCVRLRDADIQWLYENVPVGTAVYIY